MTDVATTLPRYRRDLHTLLPDLACVAEVGVAQGLFSREMLGWRRGAERVVDRLYMVDAWARLDVSGDGSFDPAWHERNYLACRALADAGRVFMLRGWSHEMAELVPDASLDLVYVDCCHDYDYVARDLAAWWPKARRGAVVAGHDYLGYPGVRRAADEWAVARGVSLHVLREDASQDAGFLMRVPA